MLIIERKHIESIQNATTPEDLHAPVQKAIELEHSTIPPYLTAMMSLKPGKNREVWSILHSVVLEEMLHMTIAANLLNALGGSPDINSPSFIPTYPGPLPMNIGSGLIVGLQAYSPDVARETFMVIEEPETPLVFPIKSMAASDAPEFGTIGEFYLSLQQKIKELPVDPLPGTPSKQVTSDFFDTDELFAIETKQHAVDAIDLIIEQGEGTTESPLDPDGGLAHYYRFQELAVGRRLVKDTSVPEGYSFSGAEIAYDPSEVYPIESNTKTNDLPIDTEQRRQADQFNFVYGKLLSGLHSTFNGDPDHLPDTFGLMYDLKLIAEVLCGMPHPTKPGKNVGPPFEYSQTNGMSS